MSFIQVQSAKNAGGKRLEYVNLAWSEWQSDKKYSTQGRLYLGRLMPCKTKILLGKRFAGSDKIYISMDELRKRAGDKKAFEAWLYSHRLKDSLGDNIARVEIMGDAWLIRHLADYSGLNDDLTFVFGERFAGALLGVAGHQLVTGHALYRASAWLQQRELPEAWKSSLVTESGVYEFISQVGADFAKREEFFERWIARHNDSYAMVYDTTSISSYSPNLELAQWGHNRDEENLPQINFSLAATQWGMPLFYRVLPGSIPDVSSLATTLKIARDYGISKVGLSLDRGFYSAANLRDLLALDCSLIIGVPWSITQAKDLLKKFANKLTSFKHAFPYQGTSLRHIRDVWKHENHSLNAHIFYDPERRVQRVHRFENHLFALQQKARKEKFNNKLDAQKWLSENADWAKSCFSVTTKDEGPYINIKFNKATSLSSRAGYSIILTYGRDQKDETPERVLKEYRARDTVEKLFDVLKNEHAQYRLRTGDEDSANGRFFLAFITLVLRAELSHRMKKVDIGKSFTIPAILDELGKHKVVTTSKNTRIPLEVTKKQRDILKLLNIPQIT